MRTSTIRDTGITVSKYGLGTWAMGGGVYGTVDDAESIRTIHRAEELGVSLIDTAPMYSQSGTTDGRAERIVGRALRGRRDRWVVSTKFGRHLGPRPDGGAGHIIREDYSAAQCVRSVEESLRRLQTDHVDILFVHTPTPDPELFDPDETFAAMSRLKDDGKIRAVGFSFHLNAGSWLEAVAPFMHSGVLDIVQVAVSLLNPEPLENLFPIVARTGTGVVAREALQGGFLTDSFTADGPFDEQDFKHRMDRDTIQSQLDKAGRFKFLVDTDAGVASLPEAALNWVVSMPEVSCVIPGAKTVAEIEQCLRAADAAPFDKAAMDAVCEIQKGWEGA